MQRQVSFDPIFLGMHFHEIFDGLSFRFAEYATTTKIITAWISLNLKMGFIIIDEV
jgi:hypothetical protein